jgi:hypothetical protein
VGSDRVSEGRGSPAGGGEEAGEPQHRLVASKVAAAEVNGASAADWGKEREPVSFVPLRRQARRRNLRNGLSC